MSSKKERNHYDLKEMENIKKWKNSVNSTAHNVLIEMFTITENHLFYTKKSSFWPAPTQASIIVCC